MVEPKQMWLKSLGYAENKSVIECDPTLQTITFSTEDGYVTRQVTECYTRVMGYHRPVSQFNIGKKSEHRERKHFTEAASMCSPNSPSHAG